MKNLMTIFSMTLLVGTFSVNAQSKADFKENPQSQKDIVNISAVKSPIAVKANEKVVKAAEANQPAAKKECTKAQKKACKQAKKNASASKSPCPQKQAIEGSAPMKLEESIRPD